MKKATLLILFVLSFQNIIAQNIYTRFFEDFSLVNDSLELNIEDAVSKPNYLKFQISITNRSEQIMIFKPDDMEVRSGDEVYKPTDRTAYIEPNTTATRVITFKGDHWMIDSISIEKTGLYFEVGNGRPIELPDFEIPGNTEADDSSIAISIHSMKRLNKVTFVKFNLKYNGPEILKIETGKSRMTVPKGSTHEPNTALPDKLYMDNQSEEENFSLYYTLPSNMADMQSDRLNIEWRDMFSLVELTPVPVPVLKLLIGKKTGGVKTN